MRRDLRVQEAPENRPSDRGASGAVTPRGKRLGARHPSPTRLHPTHRDGFSPRPRAHAHAFRACSHEPAARLNPPDSASAACPPPRPSSAVGADGSASPHASASVGTAPPTPPPPAASLPGCCGRPIRSAAAAGARPRPGLPAGRASPRRARAEAPSVPTHRPSRFRSFSSFPTPQRCSRVCDGLRGPFLPFGPPLQT